MSQTKLKLYVVLCSANMATDMKLMLLVLLATAADMLRFWRFAAVAAAD
jgi:hypothetical protein